MKEMDLVNWLLKEPAWAVLIGVLLGFFRVALSAQLKRLRARESRQPDSERAGRYRHDGRTRQRN